MSQELSFYDDLTAYFSSVPTLGTSIFNAANIWTNNGGQSINTGNYNDQFGTLNVNPAAGSFFQSFSGVYAKDDKSSLPLDSNGVPVTPKLRDAVMVRMSHRRS